ncbi:hypothetical protein ICN30_07875 [Polynucleobacter sp. 31A-FELB]|uniref:hypothetical protein n=1 Tax=Polynucleobacter sp. 31A-FELB TaxID=2689096 RepID=UPI001C0AD336|nr:hypothetical protein [Polynucleobacter sp. 31A-FELB]MBU3587749.1 hypothetical protein [Polynucleobacter sp. 31A-FELB]
MTLQFSDFYKLDSICDVKVSGSFDSAWSKAYVSISSGSSASTKPDGVGSGLKIGPLKLKPGIDVAGSPEAMADFVSMANLNHLIYAVISTRYPILYVGITEGGLRNGIFDKGRLIHHARKMLAIRESSTSHTGGWLGHAIERYDNNISAYNLRFNDEQFQQDLLEDVYIAIAHQGHDSWSPAKVEETVLGELDKGLNASARGIKKMNTAGSGRDPVNIQLPGNIAQTLAKIMITGDLPNLQGDWNVIPSDAYNVCKSNLLVVVKQVGTWSVGDILGTALSHVRDKCRSTKKVLIYIQITQSEWEVLWAQWSDYYEELVKDLGVEIELRFA